MAAMSAIEAMNAIEIARMARSHSKLGKNLWEPEEGLWERPMAAMTAIATMNAIEIARMARSHG